MSTRDGQKNEWISLAPQGFPLYEVSREGQVRRIGTTTPRKLNKNGATGLTDKRGVKRCVLAGKLCRLAFGDVPGATAPQAKLSAAEVHMIRMSTRTAPTVLAARLGVSPSTVKAARAGITWHHVRTETRAHYMTDGKALQPQAA